MVWNEIIPLLKWVIGGGIAVFILNVMRDNGKKDQKSKQDDKDKDLLRSTISVTQAAQKRAEVAGESHYQRSQKLEEIIQKIDPSLLTDLELNQLSSDPFAFADTHADTRELKTPTKDEND